MGLSMKEKKAVPRRIRSRYQKAARKQKSDILNEFIKITGCNRKYAPRILNKPETARAFIVVKGTALKLRPSPKRPANREGKKSIPMRSSPSSASSGLSSGISAGSS
jgi:hypothetical protein